MELFQTLKNVDYNASDDVNVPIVRYIYLEIEEVGIRQTTI